MIWSVNVEITNRFSFVVLIDLVSIDFILINSVFSIDFVEDLQSYHRILRHLLSFDVFSYNYLTFVSLRFELLDFGC